MFGIGVGVRSIDTEVIAGNAIYQRNSRARGNIHEPRGRINTSIVAVSCAFKCLRSGAERERSTDVPLPSFLLAPRINRKVYNFNSAECAARL